MPTTRAAIAELLAPDLFRVYSQTGKDYPPLYPLVFNMPDMPYNPVTDQGVTGLGSAPSKPEGTQFKMDEILIGGTKTYTAVPYGLGVEITFEAWRDELYGVMRDMVGALKRASLNRFEVDAWSVFNNSISSSYTGFDGQPLLSNSHVNADSTLGYDNLSASTFSIAGLQEGLLAFQLLTDERDLPQLMTPTDIVIHPTNIWAAREILGSAGKPYTTDNERNALVADDLKYSSIRYITETTSWYLLAKKGEHDLNFFIRDPASFNMFDDNWTNNAVATVYQRHTAGFSEWRGVYGYNV